MVNHLRLCDDHLWVQSLIFILVTFIFTPWLILMSWRSYWSLHYASLLQDMIVNISIHHDHIKFLHESHICHNLLVFMLQHSILRDTMNSSLELLASRHNHPWLNIWAHHDPIFKPYVEFISLIILSRSWSIMVQPISPRMRTSEILNELHIDHILFITWNSSWSYLIQSLSSTLGHAQQYVYGIHFEFIRSPSCITMERTSFNSSNILHALQMKLFFKCITQCKH
jgi:hypothetical protein